jgi:hypothetical protein
MTFSLLYSGEVNEFGSSGMDVAIISTTGWSEPGYGPWCVA